MKDYIRNRLQHIKADTPKEARMNTLTSIFSALEDQGYSHHEVKGLIDEVILENIISLTQKLQDIAFDARERVRKDRTDNGGLWEAEQPTV
jgi:hypothetical protein